VILQLDLIQQRRDDHPPRASSQTHCELYSVITTNTTLTNNTTSACSSALLPARHSDQSRTLFSQCPAHISLAISTARDRSCGRSTNCWC
jgi:hypothetical protein